MRAWALLAVAAGAAGCNAVLDFDDLEGLPCPCAPGFVCLEASERCVPEGRTEPFKFCQTDTPLGGDELCPPDHRCVSVNDQPPRCLPQCQPVLYARQQAGRLIQEQCPFETTCWASEKGGVCSEGECRDIPNNCPPGQRCAVFNGAGVCFTECQILAGECGADQICHPIGETRITACVDPGVLVEGDICTAPEDGMCEKRAGDRPLICAKPAASSNPTLRCRVPCNFEQGTGCLGNETCVLFRANIDSYQNRSLGICEPG
jgi:hypothetical protein